MFKTLVDAIFLVTGFVNFVDGVALVKCCEDDFFLSDDLLKCTREIDGLDKISYPKIMKELELSSNRTRKTVPTCFQDKDGTFSSKNNSSNPTLTSNCIDFQKNGSLIHHNCSDIVNNLVAGSCDTVFTFFHVYGASMMIFANIIYLITYILVCLMYMLIPGICRRAYDKAVLSYTITQALLSVIMITLGHFMLCHKPLSRIARSLFGIALMIVTISSVLWLLVISLDVTSTITRLRWAPSSGAKGRDENHKFRVYLTWVTIGIFLPSGISSILEFLPLPDDIIVKPNFFNMTSLNYRVIVHVASVPILVAIASSVLFIYTTVRMINIQKSTSVANENRKKSVKEKYIFYLKLYLLMDAPYITGALGSSFEDLWILKFCRIFQPVMMLYAVLPRGVIAKAFSCKKKSKTENDEAELKPMKNLDDP